MAFYDDLIIRFGGDDSRLQRVAKRVEGIGGRIKKSFSGVGDLLSEIGGMGKAGIASAVTALGTGFAAASRSALQFADDLVVTSDKIGLTAEEMQELRYWAKSFSVDQNVLDMGIQRFTRRLGEAAVGQGALFKELERAGIQIRDNSGSMRNAVDVLRDYMDAIRGASSQQERLRMTMAAVDVEGVDLVNALSAGSEAFDDITASAHELGAVLDENLARASAELNTQWELFMTRWQTRWRGFVLSVVDAMSKFEPTFASLEDLQKRLAENTEKLRKEEEKLKWQNERLRTNTELRIKALKSENEEIRKQIELKKQVAKATGEAAAATSGATTTPQTGKDTGKAQPTSEDWREKTPEQIAAALNAFRAGEISAAELGERAGLQPPGTAASLPHGAYGTETNKGEGAFRPGQVPVKTGVDVEDLNRQLQAFFAGTYYEINVTPVLREGEGIEAEEGFTGSETGGLPMAATQLGDRQ